MIGFGVYHDGYQIADLNDPRLEKIDPQEAGFFDNVLEFKSENA